MTGTYVASTLSTDAGGISVNATYNGHTKQTNIAVTGAFPGLVNRLYDYQYISSRDNRQVVAVAVAGTLCYVAQRRAVPVAPGEPYAGTYSWIDTYDITEPIHPIWLDSVESVVNFDFGSLYTYNGLLYQVSLSAHQIAVYDIRSG